MLFSASGALCSCILTAAQTFSTVPVEVTRELCFALQQAQQAFHPNTLVPTATFIRPQILPKVSAVTISPLPLFSSVTFPSLIFFLASFPISPLSLPLFYSNLCFCLHNKLLLFTSTRRFTLCHCKPIRKVWLKEKPSKLHGAISFWQR